jgi:hypothetical protein
MWEAFMDELREQHLGIERAPGARSVFAELREAYLAELAATPAVTSPEAR